jgi:CheY-like chemotaxis protein
VLSIAEIELRKHAASPQTEESLMRIYDSSKVLLNIVNDILDFSKVESGKMTLAHNEYYVASLINDVAQIYLMYAEQKPIAFELDVSAEIPAKLMGDVLRIRQIITNLLTNSFRYTDAGTVFLSIDCEKVNEQTVLLRIAIEDTGIGMTEMQIAEVKGEYIRLHAEERPYVKGTGLGIPIVYSIAQAMGATVDLSSEVGKGTKAVVLISQDVSGKDILGEEVATSLKNFRSKTWSVSKDLNFEPDQFPHGRVLVVDDVDTNLYVAEAMLESFGLEIELCEGGEAAINKIKLGASYDIIFMDHMMPGMNGIEATQALRSMGYSRPIVALTANAFKGQAEMFMEKGFTGFMAKPIDIKLLNSYLTRFVGAGG